MPSPRDAFAAYCAELLAPLGSTRVRRMFGGHGVYVDELFVAIVTGEQLFLKTDAITREHFEAAGCRPFVYDGAGKAVTLSYFTAPGEAMDSPSLMQPWARLAVEAALRARASKPASARRKPAATPPAAAAKPRKSAASARRH
jgi:DNA transformation protein and related proteins